MSGWYLTLDASFDQLQLVIFFTCSEIEILNKLILVRQKICHQIVNSQLVTMWITLLKQDRSRFRQDTGRFGQDTGRFRQDTSRFGQDTGRFNDPLKQGTGRFGQDTGRFKASSVWLILLRQGKCRVINDWHIFFVLSIYILYKVINLL